MASKEKNKMTLAGYKKKKLQDTEFLKDYQEIQPEMQIIRALINARTEKNLPRKSFPKRLASIRQKSVS